MRESTPHDQHRSSVTRRKNKFCACPACSKGVENQTSQVSRGSAVRIIVETANITSMMRRSLFDNYNMEVHQIDISSTEKLGDVTRLLLPFAPYSLPIIGCLFNSLGDFRLLFSCDLNQAATHGPHTEYPALFSTFLISIAKHTSYFFCTAENSMSEPTVKEKGHVNAAVREFVHTAQQLFYDQGKEPTPTLRVESVHEKWVECMQPYVILHGIPCWKFFYPPASETKQHSGEVDTCDDMRWIADRLRESDIPLVQRTSRIQRSEDYLRGRFHASVCLRRGDQDTLSQDAPSIAWAMISADGGVGTLYVDPAWRRRGLAQRVVRELTDRAPKAAAYESGNDVGKTLGWSWTDVLEDNAEAIKFWSNMPGWQKGWMCYWMKAVFQGDNTSAF